MSSRRLPIVAWLSASLLIAACDGTTGSGPAGPSDPTPNPPGTPPAFNPQQVLVRLAVGVSIETINARYGTRTLDAVEAQDVYLLELPEGVSVDAFRAQISQDPDLITSAPNARVDAPEAQGRSTIAFADPALEQSDYEDQDAVARIRAPAAWSLTRGAGVIVAVLDTGVDVNHPQLRGAIAPGGRDLVDGDNDPGESPDGIDNDGDGVVDEALGHGTFVAGLIRSVAPDARILPIRVLDSEGVGTAISIASGIEVARQNGARVINLSLGMAVEADVVEELIDDLADEHGLIFVASAGNQSTSERQFPAGENDVISVAATDDTDRKADFSNFGSWVDVSAPGVGLVSLFPGSRLASWSGTSFAAALASGEAALLVSLRPTAEIDEIHDAIKRSAVPVEDEQLDNSGRIDVRAAVDWLLERSD